MWLGGAWLGNGGVRLRSVRRGWSGMAGKIAETSLPFDALTPWRKGQNTMDYVPGRFETFRLS